MYIIIHKEVAKNEMAAPMAIFVYNNNPLTVGAVLHTLEHISVCFKNRTGYSETSTAQKVCQTSK